MPLGWSDLEDFLPTCLKLELKETKRGEGPGGQQKTILP